MTPEQVDIFVVHLGGLMIDLFVGFLLLHEKSRTPGLLVSSMFHIMNSQLFSIGESTFSNRQLLGVFLSIF